MGIARLVHALIGRRIELPHRVRERFPELGGVRWRRGGIPVIVGGWFLGRSSVDAITLWNTVWLGKGAPVSEELLLHEFRHVHQFQASVAFPILYLWESMRRGYVRNRFEIEARFYAGERLRGSHGSNL